VTHLGRLKAATARVEFGRGHGTAFLVAPRTLLTCAHVLPGAERGDPVTLFFAHALETPWAAQIVEIDTSADVAVLALDADVPGATPLPLATSLPDVDARLMCFGFPRPLKVGGSDLPAVVRDPAGRDDRGAPSLVLYSDEIGAGGPLQGFSGGAVLQGDAVVGQLRRIPAEASEPGTAIYGRVFATPLEILRRFVPAPEAPARLFVLCCPADRERALDWAAALGPAASTGTALPEDTTPDWAPLCTARATMDPDFETALRAAASLRPPRCVFAPEPGVSPPSALAGATLQRAPEAAALGLAPASYLSLDAWQAVLRQQHRLLVLGPRGGTGGPLVRALSTRFGRAVTRLMPPRVDRCTEAQYFRELAGGAAEATDAFGFRAWLLSRAANTPGTHLVVLHNERGPEEHLRALAHVLRGVMEDEAEGRFAVLVAGEARCAFMRFNDVAGSVFSGIKVLRAPDLSVADVTHRLALAGKPASLAATVLEATGGLPAFVDEAVSLLDPAAPESLAAALAATDILRNRVRWRLRTEGRPDTPDPHNAFTVCERLARGLDVQRLDDVEDDQVRAEVRLYYDGLLRAGPDGRSVLRGAAVSLAVARELRVSGVAL
jgi:hypothetical protein